MLRLRTSTHMEKAKKDVKPKDERKVAPIRVVNLASLQNIKVVRNEMPARESRQNRRKSVHQVLSHSDDTIEFIESHTELSNDDNSSSTIASSSNSATAHRKSLPVTMKKTSTTAKKVNEARPNENLMRRVALLRVCAEYMLKELQVKNVVFGENQSLEMLKVQYVRNTRRNH